MRDVVLDQVVASFTDVLSCSSSTYATRSSTFLYIRVLGASATHRLRTSPQQSSFSSCLASRWRRMTATTARCALATTACKRPPVAQGRPSQCLTSHRIWYEAQCAKVRSNRVLVSRLECCCHACAFVAACRAAVGMPCYIRRRARN